MSGAGESVLLRGGGGGGGGTERRKESKIEGKREEREVEE